MTGSGVDLTLALFGLVGRRRGGGSLGIGRRRSELLGSHDRRVGGGCLFSGGRRSRGSECFLDRGLLGGAEVEALVALLLLAAAGRGDRHGFAVEADGAAGV